MSDRKTYAVELDEKICMLYGRASRAWSEIGLLCLEFHEQHLYRHIGFQHFDDWAVNRFGKSRSTLREAMRVVEGLEPFIPSKEMVKITQANCAVLLTLSEKKRLDPKVIKAAQTRTETDFRQWLAGKEIGAESQAKGVSEELRTIMVVVPALVKERFDQAMDVAKRVAKTESDAVAVEFIAADFVDTWESASVDYEGLPRKDIRSLRRRSAEPAQFKTGIADARQNRNEAH